MPRKHAGIRLAHHPGPALVHSDNGYYGEPLVITKVVLSAATALGAAVGVATPASADPSVFGILSCSCEEAVTAPDDGAITDQMNLGIQSGLDYLQGLPRPIDDL
jgi:hypothetical protein